MLISFRNKYRYSFAFINTNFSGLEKLCQKFFYFVLTDLGKIIPLTALEYLLIIMRFSSIGIKAWLFYILGIDLASLNRS